jgi:hypothetical protein
MRVEGNDASSVANGPLHSQPGHPFANKARGEWAQGSPEVAVIDGYSHVNIAIGVLQQLHLDLVLLEVNSPIPRARGACRPAASPRPE